MALNIPQALVINSIWFNNMQFGLRGGKRTARVKVGRHYSQDSLYSGKEYLEYSTERQKKIRPGDNLANTRSVKPHMYENIDVSPERNLVYLYKFFKAKRPERKDINLRINSPFYLTVNHTSARKLHCQKLNGSNPNRWE